MAQAYTSFPNDGEMTYARSYSLITDSNGNTVLENGMRTSHVFSVDTARCMTEMLEAAAWYGTGYEVYLGYGKMPSPVRPVRPPTTTTAGSAVSRRTM